MSPHPSSSSITEQPKKLSQPETMEKSTLIPNSEELLICALLLLILPEMLKLLEPLKEDTERMSKYITGCIQTQTTSQFRLGEVPTLTELSL